MSGWSCCSKDFLDTANIHRHVSKYHKEELNDWTENILIHGDESATYIPLKKKKKTIEASSGCSTKDSEISSLPECFSDLDVLLWLPKYENDRTNNDVQNDGKIILFYCYR